MSSKTETKPNKQALGREFEQQAARFYQNQGFKVIAQNWRAGKKEIDLVVQKENQVIFVEVKYAGSDAFGHPSLKVNKSKQMHLIEAAYAYLDSAGIINCDLRFDVVTFNNGKLEQYPNAFQTE